MLGKRLLRGGHNAQPAVKNNGTAACRPLVQCDDVAFLHKNPPNYSLTLILAQKF